MNSQTVQRRTLGATGISATIVGIGTSAIGSMPQSYGYEIDSAQAADALDGLLDDRFDFIDTGADYGDGRSEYRLGQSIARGHGAGKTIATKVDRDKSTGRFDGEQVMRSIEGSLERLSLDRVPLLHLHDPEHIGFEAAMAPNGAVEALLRLKEEGVAASIGVAGGPATLLARFVETGVFDVVQTHNRFTLLDQTSEALIGLAAARGIGVINAAPYGGGLLSDDRGRVATYGYRPASRSQLDAVESMRLACDRAGVPLAAAALQFSARDPRIHTTIVGMSRRSRAKATQDLLEVAIADDLWAELRNLTPPASEWRND